MKVCELLEEKTWEMKGATFQMNGQNFLAIVSFEPKDNIVRLVN